jgi:hypothetical protein
MAVQARGARQEIWEPAKGCSGISRAASLAGYSSEPSARCRSGRACAEVTVCHGLGAPMRSSTPQTAGRRRVDRLSSSTASSYQARSIRNTWNSSAATAAFAGSRPESAMARRYASTKRRAARACHASTALAAAAASPVPAAATRRARSAPRATTSEPSPRRLAAGSASAGVRRSDILVPLRSRGSPDRRRCAAPDPGGSCHGTGSATHRDPRGEAVTLGRRDDAAPDALIQERRPNAVSGFGRSVYTAGGWGRLAGSATCRATLARA